MKNKYKLIVWILSTLTLLSGVSFFLLSDIPFGLLFKLSFYLLCIGLVLLTGVLAYVLVKSKKYWKKTTGIISLFLSVLLFLVFVILIIDFRILLNKELSPRPTKEEWIEDLNYLTSKMESLHPDLYSLTSENEFKSAVNTLKNEIPNYDDIKIKAEFLKILAMSNDAHTIPHIQSFNLDWHMYPINIFYFDDGIYITDAGRGKKHLIGNKITKIGDYPVEEVYERMKKYLATENEYHSKNRVTIILISEWLLAENIIENIDNVSFTLENRKGEKTIVELNPVHYLQYFYWTLINKVDNKLSPVVTNDRVDNYLLEFWDDSKTFYLQFNAVAEMENEPWNDFLKKIENSVNEQSFDRFIIDLRNNTGGVVSMLHPLANLIKENNKINQEGKLFILIGRKTFSAAVLLTSMLEKNTKAIFVGEPTSQAPNQRGAGAPQLIKLPNSKQEYYISTKFFYASFDMDKRTTITPHIQVKYTIDDYLKNNDIIFDEILNYEVKPVTKSDLKSEITDNIVGRYLFSPYQILTVSKKDQELAFEISDCMQNSLQNVSSEMYAQSDNLFATNIRNVKIGFRDDDKEMIDTLLFIWGDETKKTPRLNEDFHLPMELFQTEDIKKAIEEALKNKDFFIQNSNNMETHFNTLGYKYLAENNYDFALSILAFNIELFPESANAYDSYAEACMLSGEKELAIKNYKKSLELNPNNENAKKMLKSL